MNRKKRKEVSTCYRCDQAISFDPKIRSPNGKFIPLNPDGTKHDCPESPYNKRMRQVEGA